MSNDNQASPSPAAQTQRKRWLAIVVGAVAAIGIAYGAYVAAARSAYTRLVRSGETAAPGRSAFTIDGYLGHPSALHRRPAENRCNEMRAAPYRRR
jgi:hypothetical protein